MFMYISASWQDGFTRTIPTSGQKAACGWRWRRRRVIWSLFQTVNKMVSAQATPNFAEESEQEAWFEISQCNLGSSSYMLAHHVTGGVGG